MSGKQRRFETLVGALVDDLHRYAVWLCHDPHLAQDLVQETMLRAWRSIDSLQEPKAAKSWLITTLRREHARLYERKRLPISDVDTDYVADGEVPDLPQLTDKDQMRRRIMALEIEYREPLALQVLFGFSITEIAGLLELGESAVMSRLFRARKKIIAGLAHKPPASLEMQA